LTSFKAFPDFLHHLDSSHPWHIQINNADFVGLIAAFLKFLSHHLNTLQAIQCLIKWLKFKNYLINILLKVSKPWWLLNEQVVCKIQSDCIEAIIIYDENIFTLPTSYNFSIGNKEIFCKHSFLLSLFQLESFLIWLYASIAFQISKWHLPLNHLSLVNYINEVVDLRYALNLSHILQINGEGDHSSLSELRIYIDCSSKPIAELLRYHQTKPNTLLINMICRT
jgi:hypothetical protein